jgi:death-on-curing protein
VRYLSLAEVLDLHRRIIATSGGAHGVRDPGGLFSAIAQPRMAFSGSDLYPSVPEKATALGYSLACNHPFVDGNKRIAHAAMAVFLFLNGFALVAPLDDAEELMLSLASGRVSREALLAWVRKHAVIRA